MVDLRSALDELPDRLPPVDWPEGLPSLAGPARSRPFVAAGERATVLGAEDAGPGEILLHPHHAVTGLEAGLPPARAAEVSPAAVRRRIGLTDGSAVASVVVFRKLPAAVLQWSRTGGGATSGELLVRWRTEDADAVPPPEPGEALRIPLGGGSAELLVVARPRTVRWSVDPAPSEDGERAALRIELRAPLPPGGPLTLLATLVRDGGREAREVLARLPRLEGELTGWARSVRPGGPRRLAARTPEPELDRALVWATARLTGSVVRSGAGRGRRVVAGYGPGCAQGSGPPPPGTAAGPVEAEPGPAETAWIVHGLLAAGLHAAALDLVRRALLRRPWDAPDGRGRGASGTAPVEHALLVHAAGRAILWTGDAAPLRDAGEELDRALDHLRSAVGRGPSAPRRRRIAAAEAFREMADAVEGAGGRARAEQLREFAREAEEDDGAGPSPEPGPQAAGAGAAPSGRILAALLGASGPAVADPRVPAAPPELAAGFAAWAEWERGDVDAAVEPWRALLGGGLRARGLWGTEGDGGPGSPGGCPWHTATTALGPAALVFGLLGARADAAFGRLRLAPRIPASWRRLTVSGLRIGDAAVQLSYRRDGARHTFVVDPLTGRVPVNLVFEPLLPLGPVERVRVDGETADLEVVRSRGRTGVRVQLPLDSTREVTVVGHDADAT